MHKDEIKGGLKEAEGKVQEKWGQMTDDPEDEERGLEKQAVGRTQQTVGKVKDALHKAID